MFKSVQVYVNLISLFRNFFLLRAAPGRQPIPNPFMKQQISDIRETPFELFYETQDSLETVADELFISRYNKWMLPQIVAHFATYKVSKYDDGSYDPRSLGSNLCTPWDRGLFLACTKMRRSSLVAKQVATPEYSALVPLVLAAQKKYNGIGYSQWKLDGLSPYLGSELSSALSYKVPDLSRDRLLQLRVQGTSFRTGKNAGIRNPISVSKLINISDTEIASIPWLAGVMLMQIWVAHPSLRTSDMILNPSNLDDMPPPLVSGEVFTRTSNGTFKKEDPMPWDL